MSLEPGLNSSGDDDSDQLSSDCEEEEFHDWMQEQELDPWACAPCQMEQKIKLPTLQDLHRLWEHAPYATKRELTRR